MRVEGEGTAGEVVTGISGIDGGGANEEEPMPREDRPRSRSFCSALALRFMVSFASRSFAWAAVIGIRKEKREEEEEKKTTTRWG